MERLIDTASKLAGIDFNVNSYADIVQAIHVIQEEMGITGTTAEEASATITGSLSAVKAAWENVLVGISSGEQIEERITALGDTALAFAENYFPRIQKSIEGIFTVLETALPKVVEKLPAFIEENLPKLIEDTTNLIAKIVSILTSPESIKSISSAAGQILSSLATGLAQVTPDLITGVNAILISITKILFSPEMLKTLWEAGKGILSAVATGIGQALSSLGETVSQAVNAIVAYFNAPEEMAKLKKAGDDILHSLETFLSDKDAMVKLGDIAGKIIGLLVRGIGNAAVGLLEGATAIFTGINNYMEGEDWDGTGKKTMDALVSGWSAFWNQVSPELKTVGDKMTGWFRSIEWDEVGWDIFRAIADPWISNPDFVHFLSIIWGEDLSEYLSRTDLRPKTPKTFHVGREKNVTGTTSWVGQEAPEDWLAVDYGTDDPEAIYQLQIAKQMREEKYLNELQKEKDMAAEIYATTHKTAFDEEHGGFSMKEFLEEEENRRATNLIVNINAVPQNPQEIIREAKYTFERVLVN